MGGKEDCASNESLGINVPNDQSLKFCWPPWPQPQCHMRQLAAVLCILMVSILLVMPNDF